ncbi:MAG: Ig-like domain-containing protein, partial [Thermoanaerobaculia bacterium]
MRLFPFPDQLDRGSVLGPSGGSIVSPDGVEVVLAEGALAQRTIVKARLLTSAEFPQAQVPPGFDLVAAVQVDLAGTVLARPASMKVNVPSDLVLAQTGEAQFVLASWIEQPADNRGAFARVIERAVREGSTQKIVSTPEATNSQLPLEGLIREGTYLVLHAKAPIAFAWGAVTAKSGFGLASSRVTVSGLGTQDLSVPGGIYAAAVPAGASATLTALHPTRDEKGTTTIANVVTASVVNVGIVIRAVAPTVSRLQPIDHATGQAIGSIVTVLFSEALDPASVSSNTIDVQIANADGTATGTFIPGTVSLSTDGTLISFSASRLLPPSRTILCRFLGRVRDTDGTPYQGSVVSWSFTTSNVVVFGGQVHPEKFHLEVPINGRAKITAESGAIPTLPAGETPWSMWAEIEGPLDPQKLTLSPASDGKIVYELGHPPAFIVTIASKVWVHVTSPDGSEAASFRLGPFVTADLRGFVAPPGEETTFTTLDGIQVTSPAGAFDVATLIRVSELEKSTLGVTMNPGLEVGAYVKIDFDGKARSSLRVKVPVTTPAPVGSIVFVGAPTSTPWGTRLELLDLASVVDGGGGKRLVSNAEADQPGEGAIPSARGKRAPLSVPRALIRSYLLELSARQSAAFIFSSTLELGGLVGFAGSASIGSQFAILYNKYADAIVYRPRAQDWDGHFVLPVIIGSPLEIVRRDPATGWILGSIAFDAITGGANSMTDLGSVPTGEKVLRPRLLDARPFQLVRFPLEEPKLAETCLRITFEVKACASTVGSVSLKPADDIPLPIDSRIELYRLGEDTGQHLTTTVEPNGAWNSVGPIARVNPSNVSADAPAEEAFLLVARGDLESDSLNEFTFDFDRALDLITPQSVLDCPRGEKCVATLQDIGITKDNRSRTTGEEIFVKVSLSGARLTVTPQGVLPAGHTFNLTLDPQFISTTDHSQKPPVAHKYLTGAPSVFVFATRPAAEGDVGSVGIDVPPGVTPPLLLGDTNIAHDFVKSGGLLIAGSATGSIFAFELSDITGKGPKPYSVMTQKTQDIRGMAADRHNRVFWNSLVGSQWATKTLRVEDVRKSLQDGSDRTGCGTSGWEVGHPCFSPTIGGIRTAFSAVNGLTASEFVASTGSFPYGLPIRMELLESDETNPPRKSIPNTKDPKAPDVLSVSEFWTRYGDYDDDGDDNSKRLPPAVDGTYTLKLKLRSTHERKASLQFRPGADSCVRNSPSDPPAERDWDHFQRVTIDNVTTGQSWSFDIHNGWDSHLDEAADEESPNGVRLVRERDGVSVRAGEQLRVRFSLRSLGYIAIFGSGITVVDLNRAYRTISSAGITTAQRGSQCGRRLERLEGQDLELQACPSDGLAPEPGTGLYETTALALRPSISEVISVEASGAQRVSGSADIFSAMIHFGAAQSRHAFGSAEGASGPYPSSLDVLGVRCMRPTRTQLRLQGASSVNMRDVAIARDASWTDRGILETGTWQFGIPNGEARNVKGDLAFFTLGEGGVLAFDLRRGEIAGPAIGRFHKKDHFVFHVAVSEDGTKLLTGGTDFARSEPFIDVWDIKRVNGGPSPTCVATPSCDSRLIASFKAPWDTNHVYLDETGTGL